MFKFIFTLVLTTPLFSQCVGTGCPGTSSGGAVSSVFTRTGAVTATSGDYTAAQVTNAESTANKNAASGYVGLTSASNFPAKYENIPVSAPTGGGGSYTILAGDMGTIMKDTNSGGIMKFPAITNYPSGAWFCIYGTSAGIGYQANADAATLDGASPGLSNYLLNGTRCMVSDGSNWFTKGIGLYQNVGRATFSAAGGNNGMQAQAGAGDYDLPAMGGTQTQSATGTLGTYFTSTAKRFAGQTAAKSVITYTSGEGNGTVDASYLISANINVTASTTNSFTATVTYTDETNTSQTQTLPFVALAGTTLTTITNVTGVGPYEGVPIHIRCKTNTTIVIATVGTFTSVTYNVEAHIRHIK